MAAPWYGVCGNSSLTNHEKYWVLKYSVFFSPELLFVQNRLENEAKGQAFVSQIRKHLSGEFNSDQQLALSCVSAEQHEESFNDINIV